LYSISDILLLIDLLSCIAASLFNKLTYLFTGGLFTGNWLISSPYVCQESTRLRLRNGAL